MFVNSNYTSHFYALLSFTLLLKHSAPKQGLIDMLSFCQVIVLMLMLLSLLLYIFLEFVMSFTSDFYLTYNCGARMSCITDSYSWVNCVSVPSRWTRDGTMLSCRLCKV